MTFYFSLFRVGRARVALFGLPRLIVKHAPIKITPAAPHLIEIPRRTDQGTQRQGTLLPRLALAAPAPGSACRFENARVSERAAAAEGSVSDCRHPSSRSRRSSQQHSRRKRGLARRGRSCHAMHSLPVDPARASARTTHRKVERRPAHFSCEASC